MPSRRNKPATYDAKVKGPAAKQPGVIHLGKLDPRVPAGAEKIGAATKDKSERGFAWLSVVVATFAMSIVLIGLARIPGNKSRVN